jgi:ferredoxin
MRRRRRGGRFQAPAWAPVPIMPLWQGGSGLQSPPAVGVRQATAAVNRELCIGCGRCLPVCPTQAIALGPDGKAAVNRALCRGCAACARECPTGAIQMTEQREDAKSSSAPPGRRR